MNLNYALMDEKLVHVDEVNTGLDCNCKCPQCGEYLVAKNKGGIREHHFAHQSGNECQHGYETMIHLLAKQVIQEKKEMLVPQLFAKGNNVEKLNLMLSEEKYINLSHVELERRVSDIIPDVIAFDQENNPLLVEIKVTHGIDEDKLEKIKNIGINTIEIDLSNFTGIDASHIENCIVHNTEYKRWVYNYDSLKYGEKIMEYSELLPTLYRGFALHVDHCPINIRNFRGKSYANVIDDCLGCKFNMLGHHFEGEICCSGKARLETKNDLDQIKSIKRVNGIIQEINYNDGKTLSFENEESEYTDLFDLWRLNNGPFLAKNIDSEIAVFVKTDPLYQFRKYGKCYGAMYKNGYSIGNREIFGANNNQWIIIKKE